jgi:hypothetical protein
MAEIWIYAESTQPREQELDERPFEECVSLLELSAERYLGEDPTQAADASVKGDGDDRYLVVAVDGDEAAAIGWRPGYYPSPLPAELALERLGIDPGDVLAG